MLGPMIEDERAILAADIRSVAIQGGGIVAGEKPVQDVPKGDNRRIERYLDHLGEPRCPRADLLVAGIGDGAAGITGNDFADAVPKLEARLQAPEATPASPGLFHSIQCLRLET